MHYDNNSITMNYNKSNDSNKNLIFIIFGILGIGLILILLLLILIIPNGKSKFKTRTIMIYMVGSNLESENAIATGNLNDIKYEYMDNENINVVLIAGGTKKWNNEYISTDETSIFELKENGYEKIVQNDLKNMADSQTFSYFLNYVYDNYKTDEYDLIMWNHGGGMDGSHYDDLFDNDNLKLSEIKNALMNSQFSNKNKIEMVIFRTCLNGMIEIANVFKDYAKYMVASEEVTYGRLNDNILGFINDIKKDDTAFDIGKKYIEGYKNFIQSLSNTDKDIYSTYSILDLSNIENLNKSINDFFSKINVNEDFLSLSRIRGNLYQYGYTTQEIADYDSVDLYNLVKELSYITNLSADEIFKEFYKTVIYSWSTDSLSQGLGIYFPFNANNMIKEMFLNVYENIDDLKEYKNFISDFYNMQLVASSSFSYHDNNINIVPRDGESSSDFYIELTDEQLNNFSKASYYIYEKIDDEYYKPIYKSDNAKINGNILSANIKDKLIYMYDNQDSTDFTIYEISENDKYINYFSYGILENFDKKTLKTVSDNAIIYFTYDKKKNNVKISNIIKNDNEKNKLINNVILNLKDYTSLSLGSYSAYRFLNSDKTFNENWINDKKYLGITSYEINDVSFGIKQIDDNSEYYCMFKIWDLSNNYHYSDMIKYK